MIQAITIILSGVLWRLGGWEGSLKPFRAVGVPLCIVLGKSVLEWLSGGFNATSVLYLVYIPALWGMMSLFSYGLSAPPHKFWVWIFGKGKEGDVWVVELLTRMTVGLLWSSAALVFLLGPFSWFRFILYAVFLTLSNGFIGASRSLSALQSELLVGASVAMCVFI